MCQKGLAAILAGPHWQRPVAEGKQLGVCGEGCWRSCPCWHPPLHLSAGFWGKVPVSVNWTQKRFWFSSVCTSVTVLSITSALCSPAVHLLTVKMSCSSAFLLSFSFFSPILPLPTLVKSPLCSDFFPPVFLSPCPPQFGDLFLMQADHLLYLYISHACFHYCFCQPGSHLIHFLLHFLYLSPNFSFSVSRKVFIPQASADVSPPGTAPAFGNVCFHLPCFCFLPHLPTPLCTPHPFCSSPSPGCWWGSSLSQLLQCRLMFLCLVFAVSSSCPPLPQWFILHFCPFLMLHGPAWQLQALPFTPYPFSGYVYTWHECHYLSPMHVWFLPQKLCWCT